MLKKLLVLLVVATLVTPSAALAAGKPDFVQNNGKGDVEQKAYKNNRTENSNYRTNATNTEVTQPDEENVDGEERANGKGRSEEMRLKAQQKREETKQRREEAKQKAKEYMENAGEVQIIGEPEGSDEDSDTHRGQGVLNAMQKLIDKISLGKAPGNALNALKTVVNKFASWFPSLFDEPPYPDKPAEDEPAEFDEPDSIESSPDASPDEADMTDPALDEEQTDGSGEEDQLSE